MIVPAPAATPIAALSTALAGRKALVTGASTGIGQALAIGLARAGADVALHHFNDGKGAEETMRSIEDLDPRRKTAILEADIRVLPEIDRMVSGAIGALSGLDILINNAGVTGWNAALDVSESLFDQVIDTNLKGTFFCSVNAARHMKDHGGGAIINVSSILAVACMRNLTVYAASKAAINAMTRQLALELAPHNIRVNAFAPGPILVPRTLADDANYADNWAKVVPLGRVGVPEDLIGAAVFLASSQAGWLTGQVFCIDGGMTLVARVPEQSLDSALTRNR